MTCVRCRKGVLRKAAIRNTMTVGGRTFVAMLPGEKCSACGEGCLDAKVLVGFESAVAEYLTQHGPVSGETFQFMRSAAGIRTVDLAPLLGVSAATISRWENGKRDVDRAAWLVLSDMVIDEVRGSSATTDRVAAVLKPGRAKNIRLDASGFGRG